MTNLNEVLQRVGFSENELKVYEVIIAFGFRTVGQISSYTKLSNGEVKETCNSLLDRNFLKIVKGTSEEGNIYIPLSPKISIASDVSKNLSDKLTKLSSNVSNLWGDTQLLIDEDTNNLIKTNQDTLNDFSTILSDTSVEQTNSLNNISDKLKSSLEKVTNEATLSFQKRVNSPLKDISSSIIKLSSKINDISNNSVNSINSASDQHKKSIDEIITPIKTELEEFSDEIGLITTGRISGLNQQIEGISATSTDNAENIITDMKGKVESLIKQENTLMTNHNDELPLTVLDEYTSITTQIYNLFNEVLTKFNELVDTSVFASDKAKDEAIEGSKRLISEINNGQQNKVKGLEKDLLAAVQTIQKDAVTQLSVILQNTSKELKSLEDAIVSNLNTNESNLKKDLKLLKTDLTKSLKYRFTEVGDKLSGFIGNLKQSSAENVIELVDSIIELKEFLQRFLSETKSNFDEQLDLLQSNAENDLGKIVNQSNEEIDNSNNQNEKETKEIREEINTNLTNFQNSMNEFLRNVKQNLQEMLELAQTKFKESVDNGVEIYETESAKLKEEQALQLNDINEEAQSLSTQAGKARKELTNIVEKEISENKDETLQSIENNAKNSVDKLSRELTRFNDKLGSELMGFYDNFHDQSTGLRDQVPQSIERLFIDQTDKMENFRRDFQRIMGHAVDTLEKFTNSFTPDGKKIKIDKKEIPILSGDVSRALSDFRSFEDQIINHFRTTIEDTEDTKDELLATVNKTIQDELTELESLVEDKSKESKQIANTFIQSLDQSMQNFNAELKNGINEPINNLISGISTQLLGMFQQPLESILSKAQSIATGTEGVEQENRILLTQKVLIDKIQEAVTSLIESLQSAYGVSIQDLDNQVESSIKTSAEIITTLQKNLDSSFTLQKSSINNFTTDLRSSLLEVRKSIIDTLDTSLSQTKGSVAAIVKTKTEDVENIVTKKTDNIKLAKEKTLADVDQSFTEFNKDFNTILIDTSSQVKSTITKATKSQNKNLKTTLKTLKTTSSTAQTTLESTQNSLNDNVSQALAQVEEDVKSLVSNFTNVIQKSDKSLQSDIKKYYSGTKKYLSELLSLKKSLEKSTKEYTNQLESAGTNINNALDSKIISYTEKRQETISTFILNFDASFEDLSDKNASFILETFDQTSSQLSAFQAEILGSLENVKRNIDLTVTNAVETVRSDILNAANEVIGTLTSEKADATSKILDLAKEFDEFDATQETNFNEAVTSYKETIYSTLDKSSQEGIASSESSYKNQIKKIKDLADKFEEKINSVSSGGKKSVTDTLSAIPSIIEETLDEAAKSMTLLNEISKGSIALDAKFPELSYFDTSKEAILSNLNAVLSRAKSSVTIVAPTISWLDEDLIPKLARVSVRIISDVDQHTAADTKIIKAFEVAGVQMSLRRLDRNRYRGDIDMIMATRDKEEVILAKLPDSKDPYAFVSQDEKFIDKFSELFAPFHTMPQI